MHLALGTRLGPYEVVAPLGAGGMGEVYRARDTRLGREVAIKVLAAGLAGDEVALARFEREAQAVAALNHPNIVALFDIGREQSTVFAVSELLRGQTLRDRLRAGPLPHRTALECARGITDALAAAHERGIVHRDIKPENIFLTSNGHVKVLDFGLAQMTPGLQHPASDQTTVSTSPGVILGTVGYMAPEQVRGQATDARTDIFACGVVLYEMLTASRPFRGDTAADTMSAVLHTDPPDLSTSALNVPPGVERVVRRCLEKMPSQRFQLARDLSFALEAVAAGTTSGAMPTPAVRRRFPINAAMAALVVAVAAAAAGTLVGRRTAPVPVPTSSGRFVVPAGQTAGPPIVAVSPDGQYLIYASPDTGEGTSGESSFWLRRLAGDGASQRLDRLPSGLLSRARSFLFFSPDSRRLAFFDADVLYTMVLPDGAPQRLATLPETPRFGAWGAKNVIVVTAASGSGIYRVSPETGESKLIITNEKSNGAIGSPSFLPDGERFLYTVITGRVEDQAAEDTRAATIDGRSLGTVLKGGVAAFYTDGHLIFGANGGLSAQRLDEASLKTQGPIVELAPAAMQDLRSAMLFAGASATGVLVYRMPAAVEVRFAFVDRAGRQISTVNAVDSFTNFSVSPDGARIVATRRHPVTSTNLLYVIDAARGIAALVSPKDDGGYGDPTWMPDGQHVLFRYQRQLVMRLANGGDRRVLLDAQGYPDSVTADGRYVLYGVPMGDKYELNAIDISTPSAKPIPLATGATADEGRFSPNGKWVAYHSNETGAVQVAVIPFPPTGERWQISHSGGVQPRWSKDGEELFYLDLTGRMMSVRMPASDPRRAQLPEVLFSTGLQPAAALDQYEPVGDRFVLRLPVATGPDVSPVGVLMNWRQLVK